MTDKPVRLQLETFLGCNARCSMCSVRDWKRVHGEMADQVFHRAVEQGLAYSEDIQATSLTMDGEPLLGRRIVERVAYSVEAGLPNIGFATNDYLLNEELGCRLLDAGLDWISFSFDSIDKTTYERARLRLKFDRTYNNIKVFIKNRNKGNYDTKVNLRHLDHNHNPNEFKRYQDSWKSYIRPGDQLHYSQVYDWYSNQRATAEGLLSCPYPIENIVIYRDGTVPLCCRDFNAMNVFGNIMDTDLVDIWNSQCWQEVRSLHKAQKGNEISFCRGCDIPHYENKRQMLDTEE